MNAGAYAGGIGAVLVVPEVVLALVSCGCRRHLLEVHHQLPSQVEVMLLVLLRGACHEGRRTTLMEEVRGRYFVVMARQGVVKIRLGKLCVRMVENLLS
jgi:hypothetical protein